MRQLTVSCFALALICTHASTASAINVFGFEHTPLGTASLGVAPDALTISNIGSSGLDGVSIDLGQSAAFQSQWDPIDIAPLPIGANFAFYFYGELNGVPDQLLWSVDMVKTANNEVSLIPDASPVGATSSRIEIYLGEQLQGTFPGVTGAIKVPEMPSAHKDGHPGHVTLLKKSGQAPTDKLEELLIPSGMAQWPNPVMFSIPGLGPLQGDYLIMVAETVNVSLGPITRAEMLLNDIPSLTLTYEHAESFQAVPTLGIAALLVLGLALCVTFFWTLYRRGHLAQR